MKTVLRRAAIGVALACVAMPAQIYAQDNAEVALGDEDRAWLDQMQKIEKTLHPRDGDVAIAQAHATLRLGTAYYFLDAADSRKVIVDAWGNPPEQADGVLGMVFPAGTRFYDPDGWGAVVTYEQEGHVADDDAASADFDEILHSMSEGEGERNKARAEQGYLPTHLVGWAEQPAYDSRTHSVVWARDIQFGEEADHSLNYDVRLLGRSGVLSLNMVSVMSQLPRVKASARQFATTAGFDSGFAYNDYVEGVDQAAGYGIGGLVAAGVGVAAAKKLGLLAVALGFGKKLLVLLVVAAGAAWKWIKRLFDQKDGLT